MYTKFVPGLLISAFSFIALFPSTTLAHHSNVLFDNTQEVALAGVVKDFQWNNPHCYIQLLVKDAQGNDVEWSIEMAAPMYLYHLGWRPGRLKSGDRISATLWPLRNGDKGGLARSVLDASGARIGREPWTACPLCEAS